MKLTRLPLILTRSLMVAGLFFTGASLQAQLNASGATASWLGGLPPQATADISAEDQAALEKRLEVLNKEFASVKKHPRSADAAIFLKAVRYAIDFHEWYDKKPEDSVKKANALLAEAESRITSLKKNETPWLSQHGPVVLGFYSKIDDSPQPYGVEIPEGLQGQNSKKYASRDRQKDAQKRVPMWVWLHGRGDTATDLNFITSRMKSKGGDFQPKNAIVIHPFGRYCNGFKSAGETDVMECTFHAATTFNVDANRIALMGFSMGGAGAWQIGAHFSDKWAIVHTGAGFVDVQRYQKLTPEKMPVWYEKTLWNMYDVPSYARNFYNVPLISYSGEIDKQRDSAEYMTEVLTAEGLEHRHLIGPGMPHKYHPETRDQISAIVQEAIAKGRNPYPEKVWLQTRSARYTQQYWVSVLEVWQPWQDTRVEAQLNEKDQLLVKSKNVKVFRVHVPWKTAAKERTVIVDDQKITLKDKRDYQPGKSSGLTYYLSQNQTTSAWSLSDLDTPSQQPVKAGGTCIEDAFIGRFVIVLPDRPGRHPETDAWVQKESAHFIQRWRRLMRGDPIVVKASEVGTDRATDENLILWGDDVSNPCIAQRLNQLPVKWLKDGQVQIGKNSYPAASHIPVLIYPEVPFAPNQHSVVLNSGLTFREGHDKTNSLQNPKLPDWAILDITSPATATEAGKVKAAGFFDREWRTTP